MMYALKNQEEGQTYRKIDKHIDVQTDRQTNKHTERHINRQTVGGRQNWHLVKSVFGEGRGESDNSTK